MNDLVIAVRGVLALDDLRPSDTTDRAFTRLVDAVIRSDDVDMLPAEAARVRAVASAAESEMEFYWARQIIVAKDPQAVLAKFPYLDNYKELVRREIHEVERSGLALSERSRVLMVGTGPLPLTALELTRQRHVMVDHVDISTQALALCSLVGGRLGVRCGHIAGDGATVDLTPGYDLVIIAGLAGETVAEKQAIIDNVLSSLAPSGRILVRSARGTRALLYPAVLSGDFTGVTLRCEYHPHDDIINSVFVYEKAAV